MKFEYEGYSHLLIRHTELPGTYVSAIIGYLNGQNERKIRTDILKTIDLETERIIFDLTQLDYISSSGLELFEKILKKIKRSYNSIIWVGIKKSVREILLMYGYQHRFIQFMDLYEAITFLKSFGKDEHIRFEKYRTNCKKCKSSIEVALPGLLVCESCGHEHSVSVNGVFTSYSLVFEPQLHADAIAEAKIRIFGENELVELLRAGKDHYSHCISIGNPGQTVPEEIINTYDKVLRIEFFDVDSIEDLLKGQEKRIPERKDVNAVIDFYGVTKEDASGYDIHCWRGVSRSSAVALGLMSLMGFDENKAQSLLQAIRPIASPHQKLVKYFDDELNSNLSSVANWFRRKKIEQMRQELMDIVNNP